MNFEEKMFIIILLQIMFNLLMVINLERIRISFKNKEGE